MQLAAGAADITTDSICGVQVLQPARGYRFGLDPVLLAHFATGLGDGAAIDLCTGTGVIPLILAGKLRHPAVTGVEVQARLFHLAQQNVQLNRLEARVSLVLGDVRQARALFPRGAFSGVFCNPPYQPSRAGSPSPNPEKAAATHELTCALTDVVGAADHLLAPRGALWVIHAAPRLPELLDACRARRLEPKRLRLVFPRTDRPAGRVLLEAVKGAGPGLRVLPPLIVHQTRSAAFTGEVSAMLTAPPSGRFG